MKTRNLILILLSLTLTLPGFAQIKVHPSGVNVNTNGATTVFLSFGRLVDQVPVEAFWCGEINEITNECVPNTLFGRLPIRYDLSKIDANGRFTDIMSIPASVARRAYQAAQQGDDSRFFYVRRFQSTVGALDEYVAVTCRLAGGGVDQQQDAEIAEQRVAAQAARQRHSESPSTPKSAQGATPRRYFRALMSSLLGRYQANCVPDNRIRPAFNVLRGLLKNSRGATVKFADTSLTRLHNQRQTVCFRTQADTVVI